MSFLVKTIGALVPLFFSTLFLRAAFLDRALYSDGAGTLFIAIAKLSPYHDSSFMRYFDRILQLPSVWLAQMQNETSTSLAVSSFSFVYFFFPILCLFLAILLAPRDERPRFIPFLTLYFLFSLVPLMGFPTGFAVASVSLSFVSLTLLLFRRNWISAFLFFLFSLGMCFLHESSILIFVAFGIVLLLDWKSRSHHKSQIFVLLSIFISLSWLISRSVAGASRGNASHFLIDLVSEMNSARLFMVVGSILTFLQFCQPSFFQRRPDFMKWMGRMTIFVAGSTCLVLALKSFDEGPQALENSVFARTMYAPVSFLLILAIDRAVKKNQQKIDQLFISVLLLCGSFIFGLKEIQMSQSWSVALEQIHQDLASSSKPCLVLTPEAAQSLKQRTSFDNRLLEATTALLALKKMAPLRLLSSPESVRQGQDVFLDACEAFRRGSFLVWNIQVKTVFIRNPFLWTRLSEISNQR